MGFGPFSSESKTRVTTTSQAFNTGFSEIGGAATSINLSFVGAKVGKRGTLAPVINLTDQGAIARAQEISAQSARSIAELGSGLSAALMQAFTASQETTSQAIGAVSESQRGEVENIALTVAKWAALAAAAYFAARIFWKG